MFTTSSILVQEVKQVQVPEAQPKEKSILKRFLKLIDPGFYQTGKELAHVIKKDDAPAHEIAAAAIAHIGVYGEVSNYAVTGANQGAKVMEQVVAYVPFAIDEKVINSLQGATMLQVLSGFGVALGTITCIINAVNIYRDTAVLSQIPTEEELKDRKTLVQTLDKIEALDPKLLKKVLPKHMLERIEASKVEGSLNSFKESVQKGDQESITKATALVKDIQKYAFRQRIVHILALIGGIIAVAGSICALVACPALAITVLSIAGVALAITCLLMSKGWVENSKEGFDWKLCLPEFIRKKLFSAEDALQPSTDQGIPSNVVDQPIQA